jgi:hypothetical protein
MSDETDGPKPQMHADAIGFLRLLPPNKESHPAYDDGIALFCTSEENDALDYLFTMSRHDAERLAKDIIDFLAGKIDISNPGDDYGRQ